MAQILTDTTKEHKQIEIFSPVAIAELWLSVLTNRLLRKDRTLSAEN